MSSIRRSGTYAFRWNYTDLASAFFVLHTVGAFGILSRLYYGEFQDGGATTTALAAALNLGSVVACLALFWGRFRTTKNISTGELLAISLVSLFLLSTAWSVDPWTTARRGGLYVFFVLGVIGMAARLTDREFTGLMSAACLLSAVASLVLLAVYPSSALALPDSFDSFVASPEVTLALRGIFPQKNILGQVVAAGALASMHLLRVGASRQARFWGVVSLIVFLVMVLASRSSTSISVTLYLCVVSFFICLYRRGGLTRVLGTSLAVLSGAIALALALFPDPLIEILGKDATLTGRTELWPVVVDNIYERPVAGWGYYAFWGVANPDANVIFARLGWRVAHAHNGLLEMLLEVGVLGTTLISVIFLRSVWLAYRCLRTSARELGTSSLLCNGAIVITGVTEWVLMDFASAWTILFFVFWLMCERAMGAVRRQNYLTQRRGLVERSRPESRPSYS
ncbi:O-antigen ligase family protein [Bradyrhizobium mercantei]|uniref:O-antigen ligase family protein n=1 Tax=Bradyrhizobium mercantei TaxID=1904807 RepID=UPI0009FAA2AD|nr:O-antigen ligase family protein [Bradyrhizobium mercantei]